MRKFFLILFVIFISLFSCSNKNNFIKAAKSSESVVKICLYHTTDSTNTEEYIGYGSGVIIDKKGFILTCDHMVECSDYFLVVNGKDTMEAFVVDSNKAIDFALLRIIKVNKELNPIKLGNSDNLKLGQNIMIMGYPINLGLVVNSGIISKLDSNCILTDAVLNTGNSGGALIDINGNLVGINQSLITTNGNYIGYSIAIPINNIIDSINAFLLKKK